MPAELCPTSVLKNFMPVKLFFAYFQNISNNMFQTLAVIFTGNNV